MYKVNKMGTEGLEARKLREEGRRRGLEQLLRHSLPGALGGVRPEQVKLYREETRMGKKRTIQFNSQHILQISRNYTCPVRYHLFLIWSAAHLQEDC